MQRCPRSWGGGETLTTGADKQEERPDQARHAEASRLGCLGKEHCGLERGHVVSETLQTSSYKREPSGPEAQDPIPTLFPTAPGPGAFWACGPRVLAGAPLLLSQPRDPWEAGLGRSCSSEGCPSVPRRPCACRPHVPGPGAGQASPTVRGKSPRLRPAYVASAGGRPLRSTGRAAAWTQGPAAPQSRLHLQGRARPHAAGLPRSHEGVSTEQGPGPSNLPGPSLGDAL